MCIAVTDERETLLPSPDSVVLELERLARVLVAATGVALEEGSPATGLTVQQWRIHVILRGPARCACAMWPSRSMRPSRPRVGSSVASNEPGSSSECRRPTTDEASLCA